MRVEEGFELSATHPTGSGPRFSAKAKTHAEVSAHIDRLRKEYPEHQVMVHNKHTGQVHTFRPNKPYHSAFLEAEDLKHTHRVHVRMTDPTLVASNAKGMIRSVKVRAGSDDEAKEKATHFYKKRGYRNLHPYMVDKLSEAEATTGPANAMGSSSSVAGSGGIDTFDPRLGTSGDADQKRRMLRRKPIKVGDALGSQ